MEARPPQPVVGAAPPGDTAPPTDAALQRLVEIAKALDAASLARDAGDLVEQVAGGRFYVACVGQFKRGKSTIVNALVGSEVLPTGVAPVTSVPTIVRFASEPTARVDVRDEGWKAVPIGALADYVAEDRNPENRLGVRAVDIGWPAPLLAHGLCLVDTPGIGSVFAGNTAATRAFVPRIDVAILVIGVDPPMSGDELALVETVGQQVPDLIVVMNKADRFTEAERTEASAFTERMLTERFQRDPGPVLQVSATERLAGAPDERDWPALVGRLERLAAFGRGRLVAGASSRGLDRLLRAVRGELAAQRAALLRPVSESERRLKLLADTLSDAARQALELTHLFLADEQRVSREFTARGEAFVDANLAEAASAMHGAIEDYQGRRGVRMRQAIRDAARHIARARLDPWLVSEREAAERAYGAVAERFIDRAKTFLQRIAAADAEAFARLAREFVFAAAPGVESRSAFQQIDPLLYDWGWQSAMDWFQSRAALRQSLEGQLTPYLKALLSMNSTHVATELHERVTESRHRLEADIQRALHEVYAASERGVATARRLHVEGQVAVQAELARLDRLRDELAVLEQACRAGRGDQAQYERDDAQRTEGIQHA